MHILGGSYSSDLLYEVFPLRRKNPPFRNGYKECVCSIFLGLSQCDVMSRSPWEYKY